MYKAEVTFKANYFLLVNAVNLSNLNQLQNLHGKIFRPHMKFQIALIPIEIAKFLLQRFTEQW